MGGDLDVLRLEYDLRIDVLSGVTTKFLSSSCTESRIFLDASAREVFSQMTFQTFLHMNLKTFNLQTSWNVQRVCLSYWQLLKHLKYLYLGKYRLAFLFCTLQNLSKTTGGILIRVRREVLGRLLLALISAERNFSLFSTIN